MDQVLLFLADITEIDLHFVFTGWDSTLSSLSFAACTLHRSFALIVFFIGLDGLASSFLELSETHLRSLRVLLENPLVGFLPLGKDVLKAIISLSLRSFDQISDLKTFLAKFNNTFVILGQNLALSHLELLQITFLLCCECFLFPCLGVDSLCQNTLLLVQMLKLFGELLVLGHVLLRFFHTDTIVLCNGIELGETVTELLKLVDLIVPQLFRFLVFFFELGQLLCQVCQSLSGVLHLLEYIRLTLFNQVV